MSLLIQPFRVDIPHSTLDDLYDRVHNVRWPHEPDDANWQYGIPLDYLKDLATHWVTKFDWPSAQEEINSSSHFRVVLPVEGEKGGLAVHVEKVGKGVGGLPPLLLIPGWPSSFLEYRHVTNALAQSGRIVYVVDLPGFGLSDHPSRPLEPRRIAHMLREMMIEAFGHDSFIAQGGDWGSVVASWLGVDHADVVDAVYLTMLGLKPALEPTAPPLSHAEKAWLKEMQKRLAKDRGYSEVQATKPTTLAVGLADSPVALAAWLAEKYIGWSGGLEQAANLTMDEILLPITLYWSTGNIASANWIYWADRHERSIALQPGQRCDVPTGFAFFDQGFFPFPPDSWITRSYNMVHRKNYDTGGHYAAWTQPDLFSKSLLAFLAQLERA